MSHIPASKMPHAHAHDDANTKPSEGDTTAATVKDGANATSGSAKSPEPPSDTQAPASTTAPGDRSPLAIAALVLGGLAVVGGIVAAVLPLLSQPEQPKSRKHRKRKAA